MRGASSRGSRRAQLDELIGALERASLYGRGGGGFPTAIKLRSVAAQRGRPIIVVNAAEGEPLSQKDRYLLNRRADSVLDGAFAAAEALGADEIVIAIEEHLRKESAAIGLAAQLRSDLSRRVGQAKVQLVPSGYVTGQETALISALAGGAPKPTLMPPYPSERGLRGRPTLVCNAETYSHIGQIAQGTWDGTRLLTVGGAVANPGLVEVGPGTTLAGVVDAVGGLTEQVQAVLLGGYSGTWVGLGEVRTLELDEPPLREHGLTLGSGIVFCLPAAACPVAETARVARWMSDESAGQCGPCINGLGAIAGALRSSRCVATASVLTDRSAAGVNSSRVAEPALTRTASRAL